MTRTETATTTAAAKAKAAADHAATALACFTAAADLDHDFETTDPHRNLRATLALKGHHATRDAIEAAVYAAGQGLRYTATAATHAYIAAAQEAAAEARAARDEIQRIDREASLAWRRGQRLRNEDGSFALTPLEKDEATASGY